MRRSTIDRSHAPAPAERSTAHADAPPVPGWLLNALVFVGGVTSVGIELAASRLIAPYFGDSTFIWANLIGVTLAFLSLGYWAGRGYRSARRPPAQ